MGFELVRGPHSVGEANLHLQFTPKYRREMFRVERVKEACMRSFRRTAEGVGVVLHAVEFGPEHRHLFVGACKNHSVAQLAQRLKGASSRKIRRELWHAIEEKLWGKAFWSSGYFYRSVGSTTNEAINWYIEHAQRKHWKALDHKAYKESKQKTLTHYMN
ncbi:IS200/IS605 family transposase [Candidatus Bathyarchaeota archaeon]|nr:IS200/IS605 family transposase [Candidatus Bathyarchaeota archaeon]